MERNRLSRTVYQPEAQALGQVKPERTVHQPEAQALGQAKPGACASGWWAIPFALLFSCAAMSLLAAAMGCGPPATAPAANAVGPSADEAAAPQGDAIADPVLREARAEAEALLLGLLTGKFDQDEDLALVAEKVKGYTSWSIKSQTSAGKGKAEFNGTLSGPGRKAKFSVLLVKQEAGHWAVGLFSGPN